MKLIISSCCICNIMLLILLEANAKIRSRRKEVQRNENESTFFTNDWSVIENMNITFLKQLNSITKKEDFARFLGVTVPSSSKETVRTRTAAQTEPVEAEPAGCIPIKSVVALPTSTDPSFINFPPCVLLERCGGCCYGNRLSCQPESVEKITLKVTKVSTVSTRRGNGETSENVIMINEERHTKCTCQCKVQQKDCDPKIQTYNPNECICSCSDQKAQKNCEDKGASHFWDEEKCSCFCRKVLECSTGETFDHPSCRCKASFGGPSRRSTLELSSFNG